MLMHLCWGLLGRVAPLVAAQKLLLQYLYRVPVPVDHHFTRIHHYHEHFTASSIDLSLQILFYKGLLQTYVLIESLCFKESLPET